MNKLKSATKKAKIWVKDANVKGGGFWRNAKKTVKSLDTSRNRTVAAVGVGVTSAIAYNAYKGRQNKKNADESEVPASKRTVAVRATRVGEQESSVITIYPRGRK